MATDFRIDPSMSVNELLQHVPAALTALSARHIDTCCRGNDSLATAAASVGVDLETLCAEIAKASPSDVTNGASSCSCTSHAREG